MKTKLIIFDEQVFYTEGLSKRLTDGQIFDLVYICNSHKELSKQFNNQAPEFLMLGSNCLALTEMYTLIQDLVSQHDNIKIIVIGNFFEMSEIRKLFDKGIKSYLDINCGYNELVKSFSALNSGMIYICDSAKERTMDFLSHKKNQYGYQLKEALTKRELEVLQLICDGLSSKKICEKLFISINTVETHRKKILLKIQCEKFC